MASSLAGRARAVAVFASLLALFLLLAIRNVSPEPYVYDEADYMYAASWGFLANWTDTPSMPLGEFIQAGLDREHDGRRRLSERIRGANDVLFYRHFHGPLFHYALASMARLGLNEHDARTMLLVFPCAALAVVYFGSLGLAPRMKAVTALLAGMLFLSSYAVLGSTEVAPHHLFALCALTSLILLAKAVMCGRLLYWYASVAIAALAFCTLEIALVLLTTLAICCFLERRRWNVTIGFASKSAALFLVVVLIVWPAAILRLTFVKAYAVLAFEAVARKSAWGDVDLLQTWSTRLLASPLEWLLIATAMVVAARHRSRGLHPFMIFGILMLAATLRVLTNTPRYSLPFQPVLDLFAGLSLASLLRNWRRPARFAVVALAITGLYVEAWYRTSRRARNSNPRSSAVLTYIHQNHLEHKALLVPKADLPSLHYYFPALRLRGYLGKEPAESDRENFAADAIIPAGKL